VAFYQPQYHPFPENDEWWGAGFTEWTNTAKARPLFAGHVQPHLPRDLGFYDLRLPESRARQAELAQAHGVEAFCYYHYWFAGRRVLERPFDEVLRSGEPGLPFCLCWANESWSGIWHGAPRRILIEQTYGGEDETRAHFNTLLPAFRDPRYMRVDGRPLFLVYNPDGLPEPRSTTALWRRLAQDAGLGGLYLVGCGDQRPFDPQARGFDAAFNANMPNVRPSISWRKPIEKLRFRTQALRGLPTVFDYGKVVGSIFPRPFPRNRFPVAIPNWDNTPRSGVRGRVLHGSTPERFRPHFREAVSLVADRPDDQRLVFLKSWNEWAEGNYLEPDLEFGLDWLKVVDEESRA
jgi:hypothetical protein